MIWTFAVLFIVAEVCIRPLKAQFTNQDLSSRFGPPQCAVGEFWCGQNEGCIDRHRFHDCVADCADGSDEACWEDLQPCDGCKCVAQSEMPIKCMTISNPLRKLCIVGGSTPAFYCKNRVCTYQKNIGNGFNDCGDYSDESALTFLIPDCLMKLLNPYYPTAASCGDSGIAPALGQQINVKFRPAQCAAHLQCRCTHIHPSDSSGASSAKLEVRRKMAKA